MKYLAFLFLAACGSETWHIRTCKSYCLSASSTKEQRTDGNGNVYDVLHWTCKEWGPQTCDKS